MKLKLEDIVACDTETTPEGKLLCWDICADWGHAQEFKKRWFFGDALDVVFHNAKFDLQVLANAGICVPSERRVHDTMLMAKVLYEHLPSYSLKHLAYCYLGELHWEAVEVDDWFREHNLVPMSDMRLLPEDLLHRYNRKDTELTLQLFWLFYEGLHRGGLWKSYEIERSLIFPVLQIENNGILIDRPWVQRYAERTKNEQEKIIAKAIRITKDSGFNLRSNKQATTFLTREGVCLPRTAKGSPKFDKRTRLNVSHPLAKLKDALAERDKILGTYCDNLLTATKASPIVHPTFRISFAATRRFSSGSEGDAKLNWQNFPKGVRRAIIVPAGEIGWWFDYRQIENVLHIFFSGDKVRRTAYESDEKWSEYLWLSEKILGRRITKDAPEYKRIKSTKLGMNYGMGWKTFAKTNNIAPEEAKRIYAQVSSACPAIRKLQDMVAARLARDHHVDDPFGYRYHGSPDKAYKVVAYMIQGCAAALMKCALIRVSKIVGVKIRNIVHDDIYFTTPDNSKAISLARQVRKAMTDFSWLFDGIPIRVETCMSRTNWLEKEEVEI